MLVVQSLAWLKVKIFFPCLLGVRLYGNSSWSNWNQQTFWKRSNNTHMKLAEIGTLLKSSTIISVKTPVTLPLRMHTTAVVNSSSLQISAEEDQQ